MRTTYPTHNRYPRSFSLSLFGTSLSAHTRHERLVLPSQCIQSSSLCTCLIVCDTLHMTLAMRSELQDVADTSLLVMQHDITFGMPQDPNHRAFTCA